MYRSSLRIIAHRAGNTIDTLFDAAKNGADVVELDIHFTADFVPVIQYNKSIVVGNETLLIEDNLYKCISSSIGVSVEDIIDTAKLAGIGLLFDVKYRKQNIGECVNALYRIIEKSAYSNNIEIISFDHSFIKYLKAFKPEQRAGIMYVARLVNLEVYLKTINPDFIEICDDYLDEASVEIAHRLAIDVISWCSDNKDILLYYDSLNIDALTVNNVSAAINIFRN